MGENALLDCLLQDLPSHPELFVGAGDDCAVVARNAQWDCLLKTDVVIEGRHFLPETSPALIGRKALARCISDVAAMGGVAEHALISLMLHPSYSLSFVKALYEEGICPLARRFGVSVAGGETASLPSPGLIINVSLVGRVEHGRAVLRSGGRPGDVLCVSGRLGGSFESGRHLSFEPRQQLARELMLRGLAPRAMMDLSDGLAIDLHRLAGASSCGYELMESQIPLHSNCSLQQGLFDGEDYELLMAFEPSCFEALSGELAASLSPIGFLNAQPLPSTPQNSWQHFCSS